MENKSELLMMENKSELRLQVEGNAVGKDKFPLKKMSEVIYTSQAGPVRMNAWRRLWAACVSSGVPEIITVLSLLPGPGS